MLDISIGDDVIVKTTNKSIYDGLVGVVIKALDDSTVAQINTKLGILIFSKRHLFKIHKSIKLSTQLLKVWMEYRL